MEVLHSKIDTLHSLWSSVGSSVDTVTVSHKLQHVLYELDQVIQHERYRKRLLSADLEDVTASIESACDILGITFDSVLSMNTCKDIGSDFDQIYPSLAPTFAKRTALIALNSKLANEIEERRMHLKEWLDCVEQLSKELEIQHPFRAFHEYVNDLSWATVQSISCAMRDMNHIKDTRRDTFNNTVRAIHFYWSAMNITPSPSDPLEYALSQVFDQLPHIDSIDASDMPETVYYEPGMHLPLSLAADVLEELQHKQVTLNDEYNSRWALYHRLVKGIHTLWEELDIPTDKRCSIKRSLDSDYLAELQQEYTQIKVIIQSMVDEYFEKMQGQLEDLWNKCLLTTGEREQFKKNLRDKADTMDQARAIVEQHIEYLLQIQEQSKVVADLMKERRALIQDMINFEAMASNPRRLFQASFQLLEEERWRNTRFPRLLQLDDELIKAVREFEAVSRKHFLYGERRYLDILYEEIAARAANQTFFGFLNADSGTTERTRHRPPSLVQSTTPSTSKSFQRSKSKDDTMPRPTNSMQPRSRRSTSDAKPLISPNTPSPTPTPTKDSKPTDLPTSLSATRARQRREKRTGSPIESVSPTSPAPSSPRSGGSGKRRSLTATKQGPSPSQQSTRRRDSKISPSSKIPTSKPVVSPSRS